MKAEKEKEQVLGLASVIQEVKTAPKPSLGQSAAMLSLCTGVRALATLSASGIENNSEDFSFTGEDS